MERHCGQRCRGQGRTAEECQFLSVNTSGNISGNTHGIGPEDEDGLGTEREDPSSIREHTVALCPSKSVVYVPGTIGLGQLPYKVRRSVINIAGTSSFRI